MRGKLKRAAGSVLKVCSDANDMPQSNSRGEGYENKIAGYVVDRHAGDGDEKQWRLLPFAPDPQIRFDYQISMGLRLGEQEWQQTLNQWIGGHQQEIGQILSNYHVPPIP